MIAKTKKQKISEIMVLIVFFTIIEVMAGKILANQIVGSGADNYIANLVAEHWFRAFRGIESFFDLGIFYPIKNSVGVVDMMLHLGLPYSVLRWFGMDMYSSFLGAAVLLHIIGTVGIFLLLNIKQNRGMIASLIGTVAFSLANSYMIQTGHIYLLAFSFIPILFIFILNIMEAMKRSKKLVFIYGTLFMGTLALVCYSSVYIAMFFVVFSLVYIIIEICIDIPNKLERTKVVVVDIKKNILPIIMFGVIGIILIVPFLYVYLPLLSETSGGYSASDVLNYSPVFADFWNVGVANNFYGDTIAQLQILQGETTIGIPVIESFFIIASVSCAVKSKARDKNCSVATLGISCIICWLMIVKLTNNFSLWTLIRSLIPGLTAMRAIARFGIFLLIPLSIILAWYVDHLAIYLRKAGFSKLALKGIGIIALIFLIAENSVVQLTYFNWSPSAFEMIENHNSVAPPENCESFFVIDTSDKEGTVSAMYEANTRGWSIGYKYNVKCISGIGSIYPFGSASLSNCYADGYDNAVYAWIADYGLQNVYAYDLGTYQWIPSEEYFGDVPLVVRIENGIANSEGDDERYWNWVVDSSGIMSISNISSSDSHIIEFESGMAPNKDMTEVIVYQDGEKIDSFYPGEKVELSVTVNGKTQIEFKTSGDLGFVETGDSRRFAFSIYNLTVDGQKVKLN